MIWWTKSWNPVIGCTPCSPACDNCYAEALHNQRHKALLAGKMMPDCYAQPFDQVRCLSERQAQPLRWRKPQRVFVGNMGDLFHENVADSWIFEIFAVMARCPQHTFMLLTKRPERMKQFVDETIANGMTWREGLTGRPLPNVWLGTTIWDQASADRAVPLLLSTPAAKRFVSVEPMLGPVPIENYLGWRGTICPCCCGSGQDDLSTCTCCHGTGRYGLDWVICGGETGPGARPMHPDWARSLRDQCQAAEVQYFFKQWGEWAPYDRGQIDSKTLATPCSLDSPYVRVGTRKAGRVLDGRTWEEVPNA